MNLLKGGDKKVPKNYYFFSAFMNSIATKLETITKIATDDIVTIVLGGLN
jgi:hypothetical protein